MTLELFIFGEYQTKFMSYGKMLSNDSADQSKLLLFDYHARIVVSFEGACDVQNMAKLYEYVNYLPYFENFTVSVFYFFYLNGAEKRILSRQCDVLEAYKYFMLLVIVDYEYTKSGNFKFPYFSLVQLFNQFDYSHWFLIDLFVS